MSTGPRTAAQILALPELTMGARTIEARCRCGGVVRINIPVFPRIRCSSYDEGAAFMAQDLDGGVWVPIEAEDGWFKRRLL